MLPTLAVVAGGLVTILVGCYFWIHPDRYARRLHRTSPLAALNVEPSLRAVKFGAALAVVVGVGLAVWGILDPAG